MSDVMAIGAIRALREAGKQVPGDVSVMGFDGLTVGEYTVPTLSTIRQSVEAMAQRSVDILLENIGQTRPASYETVPFFVELRESTERK
jgi:LacI family transcriptional regulator